MKLRSRRLATTLLASVLLTAQHAGAVVAIESHIGARPEAMSRTIAPLLDELQSLGIDASPKAVHARLGDRAAPEPGIRDPMLSMGALIARIDEGSKLLAKGEHAAAAQKFEDALADGFANVALLVEHRARSQRAIMDALVGLAMSRYRLKDKVGAEAAMLELVRTFPGQELNIRNGYGTEPFQRYQAANKRLHERGHGTLIVTVNDPSALIFINEWDRPQNATFEAAVPAGSYRVLVQEPGTCGQLYTVPVEPNQTVQIQIDAKYDAAVTVSDSWVGFSFPSMQAARDRLVPYARRLIASEDKALIVVSFTESNGHPAVMGSIYRLDTGAHLRSHLVVLDGERDDARLRALAHVIHDRGASTGLIEQHAIVSLADPFEPRRTNDLVPSAPHEQSRAKWWLVGGTVAAATLGGLLVYYDNQASCDSTCPTIHPTAPYGYGSLALAGAFALGAGYLFYRDAGSRASVSTAVGLVPTTSGVYVTATGAF